MSTSPLSELRARARRAAERHDWGRCAFLLGQVAEHLWAAGEQERAVRQYIKKGILQLQGGTDRPHDALLVGRLREFDPTHSRLEHDVVLAVAGYLQGRIARPGSLGPDDLHSIWGAVAEEVWRDAFPRSEEEVWRILSARLSEWQAAHDDQKRAASKKTGPHVPPGVPN